MYKTDKNVIGKYIVDFYIAEPKIVIELDGSQHGKPKNAEADRIRDAYLESLCILFLRKFTVNFAVGEH